MLCNKTRKYNCSLNVLIKVYSPLHIMKDSKNSKIQFSLLLWDSYTLNPAGVTWCPHLSDALQWLSLLFRSSESNCLFSLKNSLAHTLCFIFHRPESSGSEIRQRHTGVQNKAWAMLTLQEGAVHCHGSTWRLAGPAVRSISGKEKQLCIKS